MNNQNKIKQNKNKWYFLFIIILIYLSIFFISTDKSKLIFDSFIKLLGQILPIFLLVYVIMLLTNYFINKKILQKLMGENAGLKSWIIAIIAGALSIGPAYAWYPLMKDWQKEGVKDKFLSVFLYNRGIKLQWMPMLIVYFGLFYSITLLIVMAVLSVPQGIITEKLINYKK